MEDSSTNFKVVIIGDSGVGKSSLLMRFADDVFEDNQQPTIGVDFNVSRINIDGRSVKLTIWDSAGQERFRTLTSSFYRGAHGCVLVYDVTNRSTFEALREVWLQEVEKYGTKEDLVRMVVGNKVDLDEDRQVSKEEALEFAKEKRTLYVESSAKSGMGVQQCFEELVRKILQTPRLYQTSDSGTSIRPGVSSNQQSSSECGC